MLSNDKRSQKTQTNIHITCHHDHNMFHVPSLLTFSEMQPSQFGFCLIKKRQLWYIIYEQMGPLWSICYLNKTPLFMNKWVYCGPFVILTRQLSLLVAGPEQLDGQADGWRARWIDGWPDGQMSIHPAGPESHIRYQI